MTNHLQIIKKIIFTIIAISLLMMHSSIATAKHNKHNTVNSRLCIVVTIKPIYNLVAALMQGINNCEPFLLLHGSISPHDYSLKLSDVKLLKKADLIVWGGDQLEAFLVKLFQQEVFLNKLFTIQHLPDLNKLNFRNNKGVLDEHFWLSPSNAEVIVNNLTKMLVKLDPDNTKQYTANRIRFLSKLAMTDAHIKARFKFTKINKLYLVFHDAYQYFEKSYGLPSPVVISEQPTMPLSIKRMTTIYNLINQKQVSCLFKEPQFSSKMLDSLLKSNHLNGKLKIGILDPLGADQDMGADGYFKLINNLAEEFLSCLQS